MDQERVWDEISHHWNECRKDISANVKAYLKGCQGSVLDVGCGSGRNFVKQEGLSFTAVDFSQQMLAYAKEKANRLGIQVNLKKASGTDLPFEDNSFDHVLCNAVLHCIETEKEREETVRQIFRVLKPGGTAYISAWGSKSKRINGKTGELLLPWTTKKEKVYRITYIYTHGELERLLKKIGFEIVESFEDDNVNFVVKKR